jgi:hypothetical protein
MKIGLRENGDELFPRALVDGLADQLAVAVEDKGARNYTRPCRIDRTREEASDALPGKHQLF